VPIVAMTAHAMTGDRERCVEAGMDGYLSKPLRQDELLSTLDGFYAQLRPETDTPVQPTASEPSSLDGQTLLANFSGNRSLVGEVIDVFVTDGPKLVTLIEDAAARRDREALAAAAHALKGSVGLFVTNGAYESARRVERAAKKGELDGINVLCAELAAEMARLVPELRRFRETLKA
jgi:CheY-like chemotaxis protein